MGHEIVYCHSCATRIPGVEFERGKAFRAGGKVVCAACLPTLSAEEQKEASLSSSRIKAAKAAPAHGGTSVRIATVREADPAASGSAMPMGIAVGAGVLMAVVGLLVFVLRSGSPKVEPSHARNVEPAPVVRPAAPPPPSPEEKAEDAQLREARVAIELARARAKSSPDDLDGQVSAWEDAVRKASLTPLFREASAALQEVRDKRFALRPPPTPEKPAEKPVVKPPVAPAPKPPSPEQKTFQIRWEAAMAKAAARDFDGAVADLGRAAAELQDEDLKKGARSAAEELKRAGAMMGEAQGALSRLSVAQSVALVHRAESGERTLTKGTVVRPGAARVELRCSDGTVFIESEDVGIATLAKLLGERGEEDRRALAILCLLEGDRESAERLVAADGLPARYWDYTATAKPPGPAPRELEARTRFYAAEREFPKMETLAAAVLKYKSLAADYADTKLVKSELPRIQKRAEAAKDYVLLAGGLKGTGTFGLAAAPRTEVAWTSKADVEGAQASENFVETEFAALPDVAYRCWALVGGCCAENFTFYLQATEATELHPKTKQKTPIDPGAGFAALVKHSLSSLKKTHEEHKVKGAKTHPKTAARWEWIPIPLPKYSSPGPKKVRLISDQQGFGVGAIVVSSTRTGPPTEADLKEEVARLRTSLAAAQEGLVGWWRFEEGSGSVAFDAIDGGHSAGFHGNPKWTPGKVGGALKFTAAGDSALADVNYTFKTVTLSAWVKHDALNVKQQRYVSLSDETAVIRCDDAQTLHFYIRTNGELRHMLVPNALEVGKWTHVVGTWDGKTQKLYKDGVLLDSKTPGGTLKGGVKFVLIGHNPEFLRGAIDEVRVYNRALSDAEIQKQFAEGSQGTIAEISVPPPAPLQPAGKPWRPLFDGKSLSCLKGGKESWKVEDGALVFIAGTDDAAQTREELTDEVRIRFEFKDIQKIWFVYRQGGGTGYRVGFEDNLKAMEGKVHELIILAKDEQVTATLDGKPYPITSGNSKSGCLQFNARGQTARILSIDVR
jgi:hypothetical protein